VSFKNIIIVNQSKLFFSKRFICEDLAINLEKLEISQSLIINSFLLVIEEKNNEKIFYLSKIALKDSRFIANYHHSLLIF
jgi:hypothetical protein